MTPEHKRLFAHLLDYPKGSPEWIEALGRLREIVELEAENRTLKLDLTQAQAEAHRLRSKYESPEIRVKAAGKGAES